MNNNRTFFKKVQAGHMSLRDIFSDVLRRHTPQESARVLIAGTPLTTPGEAEMLSGWQKPFLFFRFFVLCLVVIVLALFMVYLDYPGHDVVLVVATIVVPVTLLLLAWEMNIPRDISLTEVLKLVAVGGILSLIITVILSTFKVTYVLISQQYSIMDAVWAPLVEEPAKLAVIYWVLLRKNRKYILDGILIGMAVGTGFAIMESLGYVMDAMREGMVRGLLVQMYGDLEGSDALTVLAGYGQLASGAELSQLSYGVFEQVFPDALDVAISRGLGSIAGHGTYAALYGGGLMIAKGSNPVRPGYLLRSVHLKYFAVACLLHAANNSLVSTYTNVLFQFRYAWFILEAVVAMLFFLPLLRRGVNQVVEISSSLNCGRVTMAVNRDSAGPIRTAAWLEGISGSAAGKTVPVEEGRSLTLGRSAECEVSLPTERNVSARHCAIHSAGGRLSIVDLGSTNGTYVNQRPVGANQSVNLADGSEIWLGSRNCAFRVRMR